MQSKKVYFVSGIDTDAGKSVGTGLLARDMNARTGSASVLAVRLAHENTELA